MTSLDEGDGSLRDRGGRAVAARFMNSGGRNDTALTAAAGLGMLGLFLLVRTSLIDDAFITLAYAKNVALHLHWGLTPHQVANTATSPLNVLLLAAVTEVTRISGAPHTVLALGVVSVGLAMTTAWAVCRVVRALELPFSLAAITIVLLLVNPLVLSALGLEVLLTPAVLMLLLMTALEQRSGWFGVVAGICALCRLDLIPFAVLIGGATPTIRLTWRRTLTAALLVAAPWFLFSWVVLGSAVPDSGVIKLAQEGVFHPWTFVTGPHLYYRVYGSTVLLAFLPAALGLFALVTWAIIRVSARSKGGLPVIGPVAALAAGGVVYCVALAALHLPPFHWYYVPPVVSLSVFLALGAGAWLRWAQTGTRRHAAAPAGVLALAALIAGATLARDVGHGIPWRSPAVTSNFAITSDYERVALALKKRLPNARIAAAGEIGTLAYYCDCSIVDVFSDRGRAIQVINSRINGTNPLIRLAYRLNYLWLDRRQRPEPVDYRLIYARGPGSGPNLWQVWSPWNGVGHLALVRAAASSTPAARSAER